ncbi:MAG TPA: diguanylate cyclase [Magnetospirillum sp.]|nr:diguanylate cyclase [Magnetospirillum sp.]
MEKTREILRLFERAANEHVAWLMQVHAALMFPGAPGMPPCAPDAPLSLLAACACGAADELACLQRLRAGMRAQADRMLDKRRTEGKVDPDDYLCFMAAVDATSREMRRVETHFRRLLLETDPLTGVHNRQGMSRELRREWTRAVRTGEPLCIALADLDHFKCVNDTWGHGIGDRVLCATARQFQHRLRPYDAVYRFGGEEFLFCLPNTDVATAAQVLDRVRRSISRLSVTTDDGERVPVTVSIGVAQMVPGRTVQEAIAAADRALYAAKDAGRNRVQTAPAEPGMPPAEIIASHAHALRGVVRH